MATHDHPAPQMAVPMATHHPSDSIRMGSTPRSDDRSSNLCRSRFIPTEHRMVRHNVSMHDNLLHSLASISAHSRSAALRTAQMAPRQH